MNASRFTFASHAYTPTEWFLKVLQSWHLLKLCEI